MRIRQPAETLYLNSDMLDNLVRLLASLKRLNTMSFEIEARFEYQIANAFIGSKPFLVLPSVSTFQASRSGLFLCSHTPNLLRLHDTGPLNNEQAGVIHMSALARAAPDLESLRLCEIISEELINGEFFYYVQSMER